MVGTNLPGTSALTWQRICFAGIAAFFVALALTVVGVVAFPGAANFASNPAGSASVIALLFVGILVGSGAAAAQAARAIREASVGYTTLPGLAAVGLELRRSRDGVVLRPRIVRPKMTSSRKEQIARSRQALEGHVGSRPEADLRWQTDGPSLRRGIRIRSAISLVALCASAAFFLARAAGGLSLEGGPAALLDVLLIVGGLVAVALAAAASISNRAWSQVKVIHAEARGVKVIGTLRTIELQAVVGVLHPGTVLPYLLYLTVDTGGLRLWGGASPQVLWRLDADAVIAVSVERAAQGARTWDTMLLLFTDSTDCVWPTSFFLRRVDRPWVLASGAFVSHVVAAAKSAWRVPELPTTESAPG